MRFHLCYLAALIGAGFGMILEGVLSQVTPHESGPFELVATVVVYGVLAFHLGLAVELAGKSSQANGSGPPRPPGQPRAAPWTMFVRRARFRARKWVGWPTSHGIIGAGQLMHILHSGSSTGISWRGRTTRH
jgi:hypothetical protein